MNFMGSSSSSRESFFLPDELVYEISLYYVRSLEEAVNFQLIGEQFRRVMGKYNVWKNIYEERWGDFCSQEVDLKKTIDYKAEMKKEIRNDISYDPSEHYIDFFAFLNDIMFSAPPDQRFNKVEEFLLDKIIEEGEEDYGFSEEVLHSLISRSSKTQNWFRGSGFSIIFATRNYFQYDVFDKIFLLFENKDAYTLSYLGTESKDCFFTSDSFFITKLINPSSSKPNQDKDNHEKISEHNNITSITSTTYFSEIFHERYLHFAIDGLFTSDLSPFSGIVERAVQYLLVLRTFDSQTNYFVVTKPRILEQRHRILGKEKTEELTLEEIVSFMITEEEIVIERKKKKDQEQQEEEFEKERIKLKTEKYFEQRLEEIMRKHDDEVTIKNKDKRIFGGKDFFFNSKVRKENEEVAFVEDVVVFMRSSSCAYHCSRYDEIFESRFYVTNFRVLLLKNLLLTIENEGEPYS